MYQLRPYQGKIARNVGRNWGLKAQLIVAPTASGKTVTGLHCADEFVRKFGPKLLGTKNIGVAWVAHRRELLAHAVKENTTRVECPNVVPVSLFANPAKVKDQMSRFDAVMMVADEAHHSACQSAVDLVNELGVQYLLGLSATPVRSDRARLCFTNHVVEGDYDALINDGYLSKYDHFSIKNWNPITVARTYLMDRESWGKSAFFFRTEEECNACVNELVKGGVTTELVTGSSDRETQLAKFSSGEVETVVNMNVLTEGYDEPSMKTVFVRDAKSESAMIQQAGRVLRLHGETPIKRVVQSSTCEHPFVKIARCRRRFEWTDHGWAEHGSSSEAIDAALEEFKDGFLNFQDDEEEVKTTAKGKFSYEE